MMMVDHTTYSISIISVSHKILSIQNNIKFQILNLSCCSNRRFASFSASFLISSFNKFNSVSSSYLFNLIKYISIYLPHNLPCHLTINHLISSDHLSPHEFSVSSLLFVYSNHPLEYLLKRREKVREIISLSVSQSTMLSHNLPSNLNGEKSLLLTSIF